MKSAAASILLMSAGVAAKPELFGNIPGKLTVELEQTKDRSQATWTINVDPDFQEELCPAGDGLNSKGSLNWHVHADGVGAADYYPVNTCGPSFTGGHIDPTFKCGGASDAKNTENCEGVTYACDPNDAAATCEVGDQSNKLGKIVPGQTLIATDEFPFDINVKRKGGRPFEEGDGFRGLSVVFHCCNGDNCSARVACVTLENGRKLKKLEGGFKAQGQGRLDVSVIQAEDDLKSAKWAVKVDQALQESLCPAGNGANQGKLNWHVHQTAIPGVDSSFGDGNLCGSANTGGHYDPLLACGKASDNSDEDCIAAGNPKDDYGERCSPGSGGCEVGDQSSKLGKIEATGEEQIFFDTFASTDIDEFQGRSLVFHCCNEAGSCAARVACVNLE